jgi:hypothetical protein
LPEDVTASWVARRAVANEGIVIKMGAVLQTYMW